jgi:hypothetical protein
MNRHAAEHRHTRLHLVPNPPSKIFRRRIFKAGNVVQVVVIQPVIGRLERGLEFGKVHHPASVWIDSARHMQFDAERMAMQPRALMSGGHVRQAMRSFDGEGAEDSGLHGWDSSKAATTR